jgi:hypothetical protein
MVIVFWYPLVLKFALWDSRYFKMTDLEGFEQHLQLRY